VPVTVLKSRSRLFGEVAASFASSSRRHSRMNSDSSRLMILPTRITAARFSAGGAS